MNGTTILTLAMIASAMLLYFFAIGMAFWKLGWLYGLVLFGLSWWLLRKYITIGIMMFVMVFMTEKMQNMMSSLKVTA